MNQKPKMRKFREWAEEYFERYEDPAIKGAARTLREYSNPGRSNYNEKRLYNYVYGLQTRILCRIKLILVSNQYITKYITEYSNKQNGVVLFLEDYFKKNLKN